MKRVMLLFLSLILAAGSFACIPAAAAGDDVCLNAKAAYSCDWRSGRVIYESNAETRLPIASMCKIMTLVLCFDALDEGRYVLSDEVCVSENASGMGGSQVFLETGGEYPAGELVKSICIASANDSCVAMAEFLYGSETSFVEKMNERARELGMDNTLFVNCTGLPQEGQFSCAKDVSKMLSELLKHDEYYSYCKIWMDEITHSGGRKTEMANTNKLIRSYIGCDAGKTGFTSQAGFCLAASALRGDMRVIAVVIGSRSGKERFDGCKTLFDYAFANYECRAVLKAGILKDACCPIRAGKEKTVTVSCENSLYSFGKRGLKNEIDFQLHFNNVVAPVEKGECVGEVSVYENGVEIGRSRLLSVDDVARINYSDSIKNAAENW